MKLFRISQDVNNDYDTYSDAIVCAENEEEARKIHPKGYEYDYKEHEDELEIKPGYEKCDRNYGSWARKIYVKVEYIGEAKEGMERGVVCASYHAG